MRSSEGGAMEFDAQQQFSQEADQLLSTMPLFGTDSNEILATIPSLNTLTIQFNTPASFDPTWIQLTNNLIRQGETQPSWWNTPLGQHVAKHSMYEDRLMTKAEAAKVLGVSVGTISKLVSRGTLDSHEGKPYLSAVLNRLINPQRTGRPSKTSNTKKGKASDDRIKPILKWAGGKSQMLDTLLSRIPEHYNTYIEPFFGGGALFFALQPKNAVISDSNPELINLYIQVRDHVDEVIKLLRTYSNNKKQFLEVRALDWTSLSPAEAAARTLYLNKTCFNGLYRLNRKGQFNTPFGKYKNPTICNPEALYAASKALASTHIICGDYRTVLAEHAHANDFVFLDPPYIPVSAYSDFNRYTKEQFSIENHAQLAVEFNRLHSIGCHAMLTNSNHPLVHDLYNSYSIEVISTKRSVSCRSTTRTGEDTLVTAKPLPILIEPPSPDSPLRLSEQVSRYPATRFMGSKQKLLTNLWDVLSRFDFNSVVDLFSGSGIVSYMFKAQGKQVISNDYMAMSAVFTKAMVENQDTVLPRKKAQELLVDHGTDDFVTTTFKDLYYSDSDNHLIDVLRANIKELENPYEHAIAMTALIRACIKKRPRGIFTYVGHRYDDGRRDLKKSLAEQFLENVEAVNVAVFDNGKPNRSIRGDALRLTGVKPDLVYMDPPYYSPLSDNEYVRRYHFVEGLACDWQGVEMQEHTKTKKFKSYPTPFSTRAGASAAFETLFERHRDSILIISYSSNSEPSKEEMLAMLGKYKEHVEVVPVDYRYSFGTQRSSNANRNKVQEYFFLGW